MRVRPRGVRDRQAAARPQIRGNRPLPLPSSCEAQRRGCSDGKGESQSIGEEGLGIKGGSREQSVAIAAASRSMPTRWEYIVCDILAGNDQDVGSKKRERMMDAAKRKALEEAGWRFGDAADFLEMSSDERQLLDARVSIAMAIRRQRAAAKMSQKQLGARLKTTQPRVAKIERAAADVSLDQLVRAFTAAGGKIVVKSARGSTKKKTAKKSAEGIVALQLTTSK